MSEHIILIRYDSITLHKLITIVKMDIHLFLLSSEKNDII